MRQIGEIEEIVFFPDSGGGFIAGIAIVITLLGVALAVGIARNKERGPDQTVWLGPAIMIGLGLLLGWFLFGEAKSVTVIPPDAIELRYAWPQPARRISVHDIAAVRIEYRGTKRPSPRLIIELRGGEILEGEGTNRADRVQLAKARLDQLLRGAPLD